jgi:uncharacterized protein (TIGR02231 family)
MTVARWSSVLGVSMMIGCASTPVNTPLSHPSAADITGPVAADVPEASDGHTLESRVTKVTVFSDRARVTRQATAKVTTDPTVFAFRKLPGWVDDGSVRVSATEGRIVDVRVERNFLAKATDKSWQKAKERDQALRDQLDALDDEIKVLDAQKLQIEAIKAFSLEKITKDTIIGTIKVQSYTEVLAFISNSLRATAKARREVQRRRDLIDPEYQASQRKLAEMQNLMKLEETTVLVTLQGSRSADGTVELAYMLPGATWEPMHDLRVSTSDKKTAEVISFAVVTQTSGEDWQNVELAFATQSSTESVRIPELEALTLGDTHTATRLLTSKMSSFVRAQNAFQTQSQLWNKVHQKAAGQAYSNFDQVYKSKMEYLQVVQSKTVQIFESLQKRGTTAHFKASAAASVRGDGHPVRMLIGHSTLQTGQKIVAVPEQSLNAALTLEMTNSSSQSLLPGKVALYQDGAFLGMTEIDFIAQGERFALFLSVADHLKLSRRLDRKHSSLVRKKRNKMQVAFIVTIENLSSKETAVAVADRIPVSENKEIKVDSVKVTDAAKPDSKGIVHWALNLKPKEKRELRVAYQVEYPSELVIETRRRHENEMRERRSRMMSPAANQAQQPYHPSPAPARRKADIGQQLMDLESKF